MGRYVWAPRACSAIYVVCAGWWPRLVLASIKTNMWLWLPWGLEHWTWPQTIKLVQLYMNTKVQSKYMNSQSTWTHLDTAQHKYTITAVSCITAHLLHCSSAFHLQHCSSQIWASYTHIYFDLTLHYFAHLLSALCITLHISLCITLHYFAQWYLDKFRILCMVGVWRTAKIQEQ